MAKGDGPNPAEEFLHKLSLREDFAKDLARARKVLGIPPGGFSSDEVAKRWRGDGLELAETWMDLMKIYKIPVPYQPMLDNYLFLGKSSNVKWKPSVFVIDDPLEGEGSLEELYKEMGEPFAKILIFKNATKSAVLRDIRKNWWTIAGILNTLGPRKKRVRETKNKERNRLILELWRKSSRELKEELAELGDQEVLTLKLHKEILIRRVLAARGYKGVGIATIKKLSSPG